MAQQPQCGAITKKGTVCKLKRSKHYSREMRQEVPNDVCRHCGAGVPQCANHYFADECQHAIPLGAAA